MEFKIKKAYLLGLGNWLNDQSLSGRESRARTRFVEILQEELNTIEKDRIALLDANADKDESGNPKMEEGEGGKHYVLSAEAQEKVATEYTDMLHEDWILDVTEANRETVQLVKKIVLDTDYRFGPRENDSPATAQMRVRQMNDYPQWCAAFDSAVL